MLRDLNPGDGGVDRIVGGAGDFLSVPFALRVPHIYMASAAPQPDEDAMLRFSFRVTGRGLAAESSARRQGKGQPPGGGGLNERPARNSAVFHGTKMNSGELIMAQRTSSARSR